MLASVKVPTTVAAGSATPVLGVSRVAAPAVSAASAITATEAPAVVIGVALASSVTDTSTWYVPSSGSVKSGAVTVYWAAVLFWVMVPTNKWENPLELVIEIDAE